METIRELFDSLRLYLKDRLSNPLYAAYIVAWAILNFRLVLVLVGDGGWREKIAYIDTSLYTSPWHWALFGFGYPLVVACAYVLASPFVYRWVTVFSKNRDKETIKQLLDVAGETPLPEEAAKRLRTTVIEERRLRAEEQRSARTEIDELSEQLRQLSKEHNALKLSLPLNSVSAVPDESGVLGPEVVVHEILQLERFNFSDKDFAGVATGYVEKLVQTGLSRKLVLALYAVRNADDFDPDLLKQALSLPDRYEATVLIDKLRGLHLVEANNRDNEYSTITSFGRQALAAALTNDPSISSKSQSVSEVA